MELEDIGYHCGLEAFREAENLQDFSTGRVIAEHKERYILITSQGETEAEVTGSLRFSARGREDFPAVGDWVAAIIVENGPALIHRIFPRQSMITRQAAGSQSETQVLGANIDFAFLVQAADRDFNLNRLERYLSICYSGKVKPIILFTKADLSSAEQLAKMKHSVEERMPAVPVMAISNETGEGMDALAEMMEKGKTYCLLGSSGVGKSSLVNNLSGHARMRTDAISTATHKGRHVTSHREMILLANGSILIDNPGMREVGLTGDGMEQTFDRISQLSASCRYDDCTHINESGCAVKEAVERGELEEAFYQNYLKLDRERQYFETSVAERRKKEKQFGRILKDYIKKDYRQKN